MKNYCMILNNALVARHPQWKILMLNSFIDSIGLFRYATDTEGKGTFKLIQSIEDFNTAVQQQQEIEIRLMNKNDEMK